MTPNCYLFHDGLPLIPLWIFNLTISADSIAVLTVRHFQEERDIHYIIYHIHPLCYFQILDSEEAFFHTQVDEFGQTPPFNQNTLYRIKVLFQSLILASRHLEKGISLVIEVLLIPQSCLVLRLHIFNLKGKVCLNLL